MNDHLSLICHVNLANGFRGGERQTMLLIKALSKKGFNQKLIARKDSELSKRCQSIDGLNVIETSLFGLETFSKIPKKTLLHFHDSRSFPFFYLCNLLNDSNYIYTRRVQRVPRVNFISKKIYRDARNIICLSSSIRKSVRDSFGENTNLTIIPSAAANFSHEQKKSSQIRQSIKENFIVGHIGALDDSHKGQLRIIDIAKETKKNQSDIGFILVGSGRDEIMLKNRSKDLDNIYFAGQVENIGDYLDAFDIFIFPSRHEGLGSTLLDALASGLPIIASDAGGIPELIEHNMNGYIVSDDNHQDYLKYLMKLFSNEDLRRNISDSNKLKSLDFNTERMANSYAEIYKEIL